MEFKALDSNFNLLSLIEPHNVQWNRKYYECGTYALEIAQDQYMPEMKYIYCTDRPETGIIQKVSWSGTNVTLEGCFLEKILDDKIIYPTFYGSGEITNVLTSLVNKYKEDLPINTIQALNSGSKVDFQETGTTIGEKLYEILQTQEMSYRLLYDFEKNSVTLQFYQGMDRTQESGNNFVTFSSLYENLTDVLVDTDDSNYKNFALVAGQDSGDNRVTVEVDLSNGGYKKKVFIDERQTQQSSDQSLDQYKLELYQKGLEKLLGYEFIQNVDFKSNGNGYEYMTDYDLGTKCDIIIDELKLSLQVRIIAIYEVLKGNSHTIEIEVGNKILTDYDKLRR